MVEGAVQCVRLTGDFQANGKSFFGGLQSFLKANRRLLVCAPAQWGSQIGQAGKGAPARRPNAKAVGRLTSWADALFWVGTESGDRTWIVPESAPVQMASTTIARS